MGDVILVDPAGTVTSWPAILYGSYSRAISNEPLAELERVHFELYDAEDNLLWHWLGDIPAFLVPGDEFSVSLPDLGQQQGTFSWRAKVRDREGVWSAWPAAEPFTLEGSVPVLSSTVPDQLIPPVVEVLAGLRFSAVFAAANLPSRLQFELIEQVAAEAWDEADWDIEPIWRTIRKPRFFSPTKIEYRYSGPALAYATVYLWRMRGIDAIGATSDWTGGQFELVDRTYVIPDPISVTSDIFTTVWETDVVPKPVGVAYFPDDVGYIRVLDRQNKQLCTVVEADRSLGNVYDIGSVVNYPAGLSADPADSSVIWVLDAPWTQGAGTSGNRVRKLDRVNLTEISSWDPGDGKWTAMKVSGAGWVYLTNWDTGEVYRFTTTGTLNGSWTVTYDSTLQAHPTGVMVDGTTLYYFFYNDGTTKRFLIATEANPEVITGVKSTEGLAIVGGEMNTTTHTEMYGDSDLLGKVWKFTLKTTTYSNGGQVGRPEPALTTAGDA
jgi:hypothetical protein